MTQLTAAQLFQPAPSGVGPYGNVPAVPSEDTWLGVMLTIATTVQLPTTSWQPGAPERTILAMAKVLMTLPGDAAPAYPHYDARIELREMIDRLEADGAERDAAEGKAAEPKVEGAGT